MYALYGGLPPLEAYPAEQRKAIEERRAVEPRPDGAGGAGPGMSLFDAPVRGVPQGRRRSCSRSTGR